VASKPVAAAKEEDQENALKLKSSTRSRSPKLTEAAIQKAILQYLAARRIVHFRINVIGVPKSDGTFRPNVTMVGMADIHVIFPIKGVGASVHLEVKTPKGRQTDKQKDFQLQVEKARGYYFIVRSVEDVHNIISQLEKINDQR
jgi:hypothetical protein